MKTFKFFATVLLMIIFSQTASAQFDDIIHQGNAETVQGAKGKQPIHNTKFQPCWLGDEDDYYAASGRIAIQTGGNNESNYTNEVNQLLNTLRQQVKQKVGGRYTAIMRDYFDQLDVDANSAVASHIESAGEEAIDKLLNETKEACRQLTEPDDGGKQYIYIGITVTKEKLAEAIVNGVKESKTIPNDVRDRVRQNEQNFRESTLKSFNDMGE